VTAACLTLHAGCVVIGETGVLITGTSGAGKSALARALIEAGTARGLFAALVADDRVLLTHHHGRLIARPHPLIAGLMEVRGVGIVPMPFEPRAVISHVADLCHGPLARMPDSTTTTTTLLGIARPCLQLDSAQSAPSHTSALLFWLDGQRSLDRVPKVAASDSSVHFKNF